MDSMEFSCPHEAYKAQLLQQTIGVKIVETLLSFRGYFTLGSNIPHPPHPPGECSVIFCFLRPLTTAVQH